MNSMDAINTQVAFDFRSSSVNSWECLQVLVLPEHPANTRSWMVFPEILAPPWARSEGQNGGLLSLLPFGFLKSRICRILGAHQPHCHDKAVPIGGCGDALQYNKNSAQLAQTVPDSQQEQSMVDLSQPNDWQKNKTGLWSVVANSFVFMLQPQWSHYLPPSTLSS